MPTKKKSVKRKPKTTPLSKTLYCFVEPANAAWVVSRAKKDETFRGNISAFMNAMIARERGVTYVTEGFKRYTK